MTGSNTPATTRILPSSIPVTEDLDLDTTASHAIRLAQAGEAGITTQGSNGEAVHLSNQERKQISATTREALDAAGFPTVPVMVGCGAQSTRETIQLCRDAYDAGGDYALVLPPAYYQGLFNQDSIKSFFINRITAATRSSTLSKPGTGFLCMGGSADFMLQTLIAGGSGVIGGLGNVAPKAHAQTLQEVVARGDWAAIRGGIPNKDESKKWREAFDEMVQVEKSL
ncbi:dihydrodipicolinate synthetase [Phyllosticta citriasiana]|uniref:Dihydrodipicolinate synthetase n=1 Tax=Phyllosticta citriasiana TaxID=595635 RepID=A0ABR1KRZ4_9PEZI